MMNKQRQIFNQKIGNYLCDISINKQQATVKNINGDVSSKEKIKQFASMVKNWCDFNKIDVTRVTVKY